jgi:hypothetical protein
MMVNRFLGLSADEWSQAEDGLPVCPWNDTKLTPKAIASAIAAMLRRYDGESE